MQAFTRLTNNAHTPPQLIIGNSHSLLVTADGDLWVTGANSYGQLGQGQAASFDRFVVNQGKAVKQCSVSSTHSAVITVDGELWVSGRNQHGQLGVGDKRARSTFTKVQLPEAVQQVSTTVDTTAVVTASGGVWLTGINARFYQISVPEPIAHVQLSKHNELSLISESGRLWVRGEHIENHLRLGAGVQRFGSFALVQVPERVRHFGLYYGTSALLTESGQVTLRGLMTVSNLPAEPITQAALGDAILMLLTESGELWACGYDRVGLLSFADSLRRNELTRVPLPKPVLRIAIAMFSVGVIDRDGDLWVTGDNSAGQLGAGGREDISAFVRLRR